MRYCRKALRGLVAATYASSTLLLCGFTFREDGPPELHYKDYNARPPHGNTVTVCHAHGCQRQDQFTFTADDISDLTVLMDYTRDTDTPEGERKAIAYAIGWMERRVGPATGTANDRASLGFFNASGQLDCVDEATNTTSYLLILQRNGLLRHHRVIRPFSKASFFQWPHFAAMIEERRNGVVYAIDSGVGPNGTNPAIQLASQWYVNEGGGGVSQAIKAKLAPAAMPQSLPPLTAPTSVWAPPPEPAPPEDTMAGLVEQALGKTRSPVSRASLWSNTQHQSPWPRN